MRTVAQLLDMSDEELDEAVKLLVEINKGRETPLLTSLINGLLYAIEPDETDMMVRAKECYKAYPRHVGGKAAVLAFAKAQRKIDGEALLEAVKSFARANVDKEVQYIPLAMTWCNQERWEDEKNPKVRMEREKSSDPYNAAAIGF